MQEYTEPRAFDRFSEPGGGKIMGMTIAEKIIGPAIVDSVKPGDIIQWGWTVL